MKNEERANLLEEQKKQLQMDAELFKNEYINKIKQETLEKDNFDQLSIFGNYYQLAVDAFPELNEKWETFKKVSDEYENKKLGVETDRKHKIDEILETNGLTMKSYYSYTIDHDKELNSCLYINDEQVAYIEGGSENKLLNEALKAITNVDGKILNKYDKLVKSADKTSFGFRKNILNTRIDELSKKNSKLATYIKYKEYLPKIQEAISQVEYANAEAEKASKSIDEDYSSFVSSKENTVIELKKLMNSKSTNILALAYVNIYKKNYGFLQTTMDGASGTLIDLLTKDVEYYSKGAVVKIGENLEEWLKVSGVAEKIHENFKQNRKLADGTFEQKWKKVQDKNFENMVKKMPKLPSNLRVVDGNLEQDIANTSFYDLCFNCQLEDFEVAKIMCDIRNTDYLKQQRENVKKMIYNEWLNKNPWAKDTTLEADFIELMQSQKNDDLKQFVFSEKTLKK